MKLVCWRNSARDRGVRRARGGRTAADLGTEVLVTLDLGTGVLALMALATEALA